MNYLLVLKLMGGVMYIEAVCMLPALFVALIYQDGDAGVLLVSSAFTGVFGMILNRIKVNTDTIRQREGMVTVALSWILLSFFGALPFFLSGCFGSFINCFFEAASGFTTTGASVLTNVEALPRGIVFWRSFTQWIGGMGVLVFMLAILPKMSASHVNLLKAESPGPSPSKFVPKLKETAKIMYSIYFVMTIANIVLLILAGMPVFDSFIHALGTAGTGGFSNMSASAGAYGNVAAEVILSVFMLLFGVNFTLYFYLIRGDFKTFFKNEELRLYFFMVLLAFGVVAWNISDSLGVKEALRQAGFQVSAVVTTTGYSSADFNQWPTLSKAVLVVLMLTGSCAGSTGGGIKMIRILAVIKAVRIEFKKLLYPKVVYVHQIDNKRMEFEILYKILIFMVIYFGMFLLGMLLLAIEGKDLVTCATAAIAAISNSGLGLGLVGPFGNYAHFTDFSKAVLSCLMIAGRLEFFPFLALFMPAVWKPGLKDLHVYREV